VDNSGNNDTPMGIRNKGSGYQELFIGVSGTFARGIRNGRGPHHIDLQTQFCLVQPSNLFNLRYLTYLTDNTFPITRRTQEKPEGLEAQGYRSLSLPKEGENPSLTIPMKHGGGG
jgi:hypothetical protein